MNSAQKFEEEMEDKQKRGLKLEARETERKRGVEKIDMYRESRKISERLKVKLCYCMDKLLKDRR